MFIDAQHAPKEIKAAVVVVGSGPAGLSLALDLANAGVDTALLESGLRAPDPSAAALARAVETPPGHVRPEDLCGRRFGGLSWSWGGRCVAYDEIDFEERPFTEAPGWPVTRAEIMREADAAADFLGVGRPDFDVTCNYLSTPTRLAGTLERWCAEPQLARRHERAARKSKSLRVYLGVTCTGADIDADGRVRRLTARAASGREVSVKAPRFVLATGGVETARLLLWLFESLPADAKPPWLGRGYMGHLKGQIADLALHPQAARALDYVLTDNTCFTRTRFGLPAETMRRNDLLNIAFHIDNPPISDPAHRSAGLSLMRLALATPGVGPMLSPEPMRSVLLGDSDAPRTGAHLANVFRRPLEALSFGAKALHGRKMRPVRPGLLAGASTGRYALTFYAEQAAVFSNGVALAEERDSCGVPRIRIFQKAQDAEAQSVLRAHELLTDALLAEARMANAGLSFTYRDSAPARIASILAQSGDGYHQIGLARMGADRSTSVVDTDAKVHGLANLYVAGSAVFPTSSQANPTFTIVCQALRLSKHLQRLVHL